MHYSYKCIQFIKHMSKFSGKPQYLYDPEMFSGLCVCYIYCRLTYNLIWVQEIFHYWRAYD